MDEFHTMPGYLVRRAHQVATALFAEECATLDLTPVQYAALSAVGANPGVDATRLSALVALDRSTLGDVLERLEAKGWVFRWSSPQDRRAKLLRLSPTGVRLLQAAGPAVRRVQERLLAPLDPADRAPLLDLLGRLAEFHNEVAPAPLRLAARRQA